MNIQKLRLTLPDAEIMTPYNFSPVSPGTDLPQYITSK